MTKKDLVEELRNKVGLKAADAAKAVDTVFDAISGALKKGDKVQLVGFGTFEVRKRKARKGINPQTGEAMKIAATNTPAFKPGKALKEAVAKKKK